MNDKYAVSLKITDFETGTLPVDNFVRPKKIFTADKNIILQKAGHISTDKIKEVITTVIKIISDEE
jgi:hypothetical protein